MKSIFILLGLLSTAFAMHPKTNNALVIHNIKHFDVLYSKFISVLKATFTSVTFESVSSASAKKSTYVYKKPIYDLVIMMIPRSNEAMQFAEKLELLKFYDEGNNLLFLSDSYVVQNWRVLLSQFGFDATTIENTKDGYCGIQTSTESKRIFINKESIQHPKLANNIQKGLVYEGGAISLTPYENLISWTLLEAPENSLFVTDVGAKQILDSNKLNLVCGAQGPTNKARLAMVGSFKMFSNQINAESDGDNIIFFKNLISWLRFETQVMTIKNYSVCNSKTGLCGNPLYLPNQHGFFIKFQIFDEDNNFYVPSEGNLSIKITKQVLHMNIGPEIIEEDGQRYYYKAFGPIENGSYKIKIVHNKPGYFMDFKENIRMLHAITTPIDNIELFQIEGLPFFIIIMTVMMSALNLIRLTVNRKDAKLD